MRKAYFHYVILAAITLSVLSCQDEIIQFDSPLTTRSQVNDLTEYYWYRGEKKPIIQVPDASSAIVRNEDMQGLIDKLNYDGMEILPSNVSDYEITGVDWSDGAKEAVQGFSRIKLPVGYMKAQDYEEVYYAAPYYQGSTEGEAFPLANLVFVSLQDVSGISILRNQAKALNVEFLGSYPDIPGMYVLMCSRHSQGTALEIANKLQETGEFEYAQAAFINYKPQTSDPLYSRQWNLHNTGQISGSVSGVDINFEQASSLISSSSSVTVAVIDNGVKLNHPDLNLTSYSWDARYSVSPSAIWGSSSDPVYEHGTNVAGIISSKANSLGGVGVASGIKSMPISINYDDPSISLQIAAAIRKAADQGASVINLSLNTGTYDSAVSSAIDYATENGRGKLGCVIVCSTGNTNNSFVQFPANYSPSDGIIAVGALSFNGHRWTDYAYGHIIGSNYGNGLDIVAPGRKIVTTTTSGGYRQDFEGTSAAAPHVAAAAALILANNSSLTYREVEYIITRTARKSIGNYTFTNGGYKGTWNSEVGHGLLDLSAALTMANSCNSSGSASIACSASDGNSSGNGYAWANLQASPASYSYTYLWTGEFFGDCDRWYISPSGYAESSADVSVYLNPGQSGGTLVVKCSVFNGNTFIGRSYYYFPVSPMP